MLRLLIVSALSLSSATAFVAVAPQGSTVLSSGLYSKKSGDEESVNQQAFAAGSFVEFVEKSRIHIGKIKSVEHKSSGGARYQ
jgi:hypothetical protein